MYAGLLAAGASALLVVGVLLGLGRWLAPGDGPLQSMPFQSGWLPEEHALSRFHVRWYLVTLVFLAFDVEMLFMYPWAAVLPDLGAEAVVEMFVFLGALLVAVFWARREGALRWA